MRLLMILAGAGWIAIGAAAAGAAELPQGMVFMARGNCPLTSGETPTVRDITAEVVADKTGGPYYLALLSNPSVLSPFVVDRDRSGELLGQHDHFDGAHVHNAKRRHTHTGRLTLGKADKSVRVSKKHRNHRGHRDPGNRYVADQNHSHNLKVHSSGGEHDHGAQTHIHAAQGPHHHKRVEFRLCEVVHGPS